MNDIKEQDSRAFKLNNGANEYVCQDCTNKHSERDPYDGTITLHNGQCYICGETKIVGPSRKSFGFHRFH